MSYMGYQGQDQPCKPSPDFTDAKIVARGNKIIEDIGLEEAYATGLISDDVMTQIMEKCRETEYFKLFDQMREDEEERIIDRNVDAYIERMQEEREQD
jgi:hypothetical protein